MKFLATFMLGATLALQAQVFSQRGFIQSGVEPYPQIVSTDRAHGIGEALVRYEPKWRPKSWLTVNASVEARVDTHRQVQRELHLDWFDRSLARPMLATRQLSAVFTKQNWTVTLGKQFVRWGQAEFLNPTDRFAPKDLLNIVDQDTLAVTAARVTYAPGANTFDIVWQPRFTPGRIPLPQQRWTFLPQVSAFDIRDGGAVFPGRSAFGARWNHDGGGYEYSLSFYDGYNYLPAFTSRLETPSRLAFSRIYPALRLYGGDFAVPLSPFTVKVEAAYYTSPTKQQDQYVLYLAQLERQFHELRLVFYYAGEVVTSHSSTPQFAAERGFARALFGQAYYTLDANRNLTLDVVVRQNGRGSLVKPGYSQGFGEHWRATCGFAWLRGEENDFLGQYHRNSFFSTELRYSF